MLGAVAVEFSVCEDDVGAGSDVGGAAVDASVVRKQTPVDADGAYILQVDGAGVVVSRVTDETAIAEFQPDGNWFGVSETCEYRQSAAGCFRLLIVHECDIVHVHYRRLHRFVVDSDDNGAVLPVDVATHDAVRQDYFIGVVRQRQVQSDTAGVSSVEGDLLEVDRQVFGAVYLYRSCVERHILCDDVDHVTTAETNAWPMWMGHLVECKRRVCDEQLHALTRATC